MSPYQPGYQAPNLPQAAPRRSGAITTVAIVSILLGLCCGIGSLYQIFYPQVMEMQKTSMAVQQKQIESDINASKTRRIEELRQERETADDARKAEIDGKIAKEEAKKAPDITKLITAMAPPQAGTFFRISGITGALIQALLLASGIGLLSLRRWAWTGNIAASVLQILLSVGTFAYQVTVLGPSLKQAMADFMNDVGANAEGAEKAQIESMVGMMGTTMNVMSGIGMFLGVLWFSIAISLLCTRRSREIFAAVR